ncbi:MULTISPECIES: helix-turn-helix domain-containing protein [unclassified Micromonospora]|uniref:helix-turn-helix domain-containing protein n=1 Tax=unclassified Micromonospora TaxID=2617518 RepID=UPI003A8B9406
MAATIGERLRQLRVERGLSQTELAREIVSPSYVSLIEANKRVPEQEILEALAERLGTTADFIAYGQDAADSHDDELGLRYAELALANGQVSEALTQFQRLASEGRSVRYAAAWGAARALEARGRLEEAIAQIEYLLIETRAGRAGTPGLLMLLTAQCRLYRMAGDLNRSIEVGERAMEEIQTFGLRGTEDEIRLASTLVGSYWERGDWIRAELMAQETLRRAETQGTRKARGPAYWNASLIAESNGRLNLAIELAERALAMYAEEDDERAIAMLRTNYAWLLLRRDPPDVARAHNMLRRAYAVFERERLETQLAHCEAELSAVALHEGRVADAEAYARKALARLDGRPVLEVARLHMALAYALAARGDADAGVEAALAASGHLGRLDAGRQALAVWREIADFLAATGRTAEALETFRQLADAAGTRPLAMPQVARERVPSRGE